MDGNKSASGHNNTFKYTLYGALFGCCFPIFSVGFELYGQQLGFSLANILLVQAEQPLHWVIDTAPFFLGFFARLAGKRQDQIVRINSGLEKRLRQSNALRQIRGEVWKMKSAGDIEHVSEVLKRSLDDLELPYAYCGINLVDFSFEKPMFQYSNAAKEGKWMQLGGFEEDHVVFQCWQSGVPAYRPDLEAEDPHEEREQLGTSYGVPIRSVLDIPFSHGTLAVNSVQQNAFSQEQIKLLEEVAQVLSEGFRRVEDLRALEKHNGDLEEMLQQKEVLLKELHHRVKNNMQVMMSLLRMQIRRTDEVAKLPLEDALSRLRAMTHALEWLHLGSDMGKLDLGQYLARLVEELQSLFPEGVELQIERVQLGVHIEQVVPIGLIVNELITNALQHAFPEGERGLVRVGLSQGGMGELVVEVVDDGVGLPVEKKDGDGGIGLTLINSLAAQLDGRLEVERLQRGTRMRVVCPSVLAAN